MVGGFDAPIGGNDADANRGALPAGDALRHLPNSDAADAMFGFDFRFVHPHLNFLTDEMPRPHSLVDWVPSVIPGLASFAALGDTEIADVD